MQVFNQKKITIIAGHYGSGKTTAAVHYALRLRRVCAPVALCDMDIVNPYFRTADFAGLLAQNDVELISSPFANTNVEMPWAPTDALRLFDDARLTGVIDLGGDDSGALALGRYTARLQGREDVAMLLTVNACRPLTRNTASLLQVCRSIETAVHLPFTGLANTTNLGRETTANIITESFPLLRALRRALQLPVAFTAVRQGLALDLPEDMGERLEIRHLGNRFQL
ncbi:MAG: hypothetical protein LBB50_03660 [Oscillospiraceae bacterium]|nr:hypothetical protein [Oscillospiraceae bacterium]